MHSTAFSTCDSGETVSDDQRLREVSQSHYPVSLFSVVAMMCLVDIVNLARSLHLLGHLA